MEILLFEWKTGKGWSCTDILKIARGIPNLGKVNRAWITVRVSTIHYKGFLVQTLNLSKECPDGFPFCWKNSLKEFREVVYN